MKSGLTVGARLTAGAAGLFLLMVVLGAVAITALSSFRDQYDTAVDKTAKKAELANRINIARALMMSEQRGVILSTFANDPAERESHKAAFRTNAEAALQDLAEIRPLLVDAEGRSLADDMAARLADWQSLFGDLTALAEAGNPLGANEKRKAAITPVSDRLDHDANRFSDIQDQRLATTQQLISDQYERSVWWTAIVLALGMGLGGVMFWVVRDVNRSLRGVLISLLGGAQEVAGTAMQVSSSSQALAQG
ncbi:MAG: MCP four helix bundle domain-containing protein, partial [Acidobacteriota bacterium]|nr:MCP four helix bundle domain-containing protein [Acidobacteriota bacterium]